MQAIHGSTIRHIAVAPRIGTAPLRTGTAVRHAVTLWPTAKLAPGKVSAGRAAICPALGVAAMASAGLGEPPALATVLAEAERQEVGTSRVAAPTGVPLEGVPEDSADRARAPAAAAVPPAWEAEAAAVAAVGGADRRKIIGKENQSRINHRRTEMKSIFGHRSLSTISWIVGAVVWVFLSAPVLLAAQQSAAKAAPASFAASAKTFDTPQQAADALVDAAEKFDVGVLEEIFGPEGDDIVLTGEYPQDRQRALDFAAQAREKKSVSVDPKSARRAFLLVGKEDWPFPVPIVKRGDKWAFDAKAGRRELLYRRVGSNELDAIAICRRYVEAQREYALQKREGYDVNQYAQRIISTPGKQDGLAWQNPSGTLGGPIAEPIARAIEQGYTSRATPYHGYFFKILKGQGPAAPLGEMDFVVEGVMIGGFALVAAPAEYGQTGVKTFIVSHDGVVYQKDFGPATLDKFKNMERFNPDKSWTPVLQE
jgi:Protein of unknown function (DUF2950)